MHTLLFSKRMSGKSWGTASLLLCVVLCAHRAPAAMEIQGIDNNPASAVNYDRYDNSSTWIGLPANWPAGPAGGTASSPYVWSGVGRDANGYWATAISPSFVVSANHFHPPTGDTIQFNYDNNPSGPSESRTIIGWENLDPGVASDQGDVWIGELSAPLSSNVQTYPILSFSTASTPYNGLGIDTFGLSGAFPGNTTSVRLGRNVIDAGSAHFYSQSSLGLASGGFVYTYEFNNPGVGPDESFVQPGDSGGPSFFLYGAGSIQQVGSVAAPTFGAVPALLGTHWFEGTENDNTEVSGDSWLTKYTSDIQTVMGTLATQNVLTNGAAVNEHVTTIAPIAGDFNLDGHVSMADVTALLAALADLPDYEAKHGMNDFYLDALGNINNAPTPPPVTNATLQALLNFLNAGGGSFSQVPEPGSLVLFGLGGAAMLHVVRRRRSAGR